MTRPAHCPTCGIPVRVVGNTTKHYEPLHGCEELTAFLHAKEQLAIAADLLEEEQRISKRRWEESERHRYDAKFEKKRADGLQAECEGLREKLEEFIALASEVAIGDPPVVSVQWLSERLTTLLEQGS